METIRLVLPTMEHREAAEQYKQEFFENGQETINGSAQLHNMEYIEWLKNIQNNRCAQTVRADWVIADTFFAVRESDNQIIGMIDIRHSLDNEFLTQFGGHIGYSVRPSQRRKGYAADMLRQALDYARSIPLSKVMLGCFSDNIASINTIRKCGGVLTKTSTYLDNRSINIYWIELQQH